MSAEAWAERIAAARSGELRQLVLFNTPAMEAGHQYVSQCASCGVLVAVPTTEQKRPLGACPICGGDKWWRQHVPDEGHVAGPFHVRRR